ncbi:glycosyltransferase [Rufibacter roseolus]|uniref:glycosyltransferase n=1 Tax=Rufibacter roseolus TaxID=2817375 RepID=UPI001B30F4AD|nr:glycosyltransferase [Rufibacter roseolus]
MLGQPLKENAIAIVVNQDFARYAKTLINSIKKNWVNHPPILLFLTPDVDRELENAFSLIPKVSPKRFNPQAFEYRELLIDKNEKFESKSFNDAGFFIVNFWSDLFSEYNNILVLDADMLVLKDLSAFMEEDSFLGISAANERILPVFSFNRPLLSKALSLTNAYCKALAMGIFLPPFASMNSGVLRIGPQDRTPEKYRALLKILKEFRASTVGDQEIIYLWMQKFNKPISFDFRMNFQARFFNAIENNQIPIRFRRKVIEASKDVHILHFNGAKPDSPDFLHHPWTKDRHDLVALFNSYS